MLRPTRPLLDKSFLMQIAIRKFLPGIAWFFIVLFLICLPGDDLPEPDSWMKTIMLEKWVHAGMFGLLGLLFMWPVGRSALGRKEKQQIFIRIAMAVCVWGIATEFIQKFFVAGRTFDIMDWAADTAGVIAAFIIARTKLL